MNLSQRTAAAFGLACYLVTLPLYSPTVTPFQRFDGLASFIGGFAPWSLGFAAAAAVAFAVAARCGAHVPGRILAGIGGVLYLAASLAFGMFALDGFPFGEGLPVGAFALLSGVADVMVGLAWGRVFKRLDRKSSLAGIGVAAVLQVPLGLCVAVLPSVLAVSVFGLAAAAAAVLPLVLGMADPAPEQIGDGPAASAPGRNADASHMRAFAAVVAPTAIGLLAFAFVMGTMRALIVQAHPMHLAALLAGGAVLCAFSVIRTRRTVSSIAYRTIIPVLAVLLLAETNISMALFGGSAADTVMLFLLYTLAALFTISAFAAVAHAGEFSSDLVFGTGISLFCLASVAGLSAAEVMSEEAIKVSTTVITTVYAFAMVALPSLRAGDARGISADLEVFERVVGEKADGSTAGGEKPSTAEETPTSQADTPLDQAAAPTFEERLAQVSAEARLTARETEIIGYLAQGYGGGYIGEALYISPNTVRTHVHNIYGKLGVASREEIIELVRNRQATP